jgi:hypothetical protein
LSSMKEMNNPIGIKQVFHYGLFAGRDPASRFR